MQAPVYLINLDRSPDRLRKCTVLLEKQNITFERVAGVLGTALSEQQLHQHYSEELNQSAYHRPLSKGEIGCYFSHRKAWQKIAEGEAEYGIVLEDDIDVVGDLTQVLRTLDSLIFSWDLIKLAAYKTRTRKIVHSVEVANNMKLVVHAKPMSGGAATALSKAGAKKLLAATEQFGRPADSDIQHFWEKNIEVLSLLPYPFMQDLSYDTTIAGRKQKHKNAFLKRKRLQIGAAIKNSQAIKQQIQRLQQKGR